MKNTNAFAVALLAVGLVMGAPARAEEDDHSTGGRVIPVHRFRLLDENDQPVRPSGLRSWPMSTRTTCGDCHDYGKISGGFHFNAAMSDAPGRPTEPWVWVDRSTGTQLPLSYRDRPGAYKPGEIGITPWRFTQLFGRHLPGGGVSEPADPDAEFIPEARWLISGKLEVNCLGCHSTSTTYSPSEWAKQVGRENFRWAATAASGMGDAGGMASKAPDTWIPTINLRPDANIYNETPAVRYNERLFDYKQRTFMDLDKPADKRCLYCHSTTKPGKHDWQVSGDVHTAAGLKCVSCHRNGEDHEIIRGYEGEADHRKDPAVAELSCRGCHYGVEGAKGAAAMGGRLGAPRPRHPGLPPLHLDKMTCTACHSGPVPAEKPTRVWTSRANRLGIAGAAQWRTDAPGIVEPVFMRDAAGKIAPYRMMWPAFWGTLDGEKVTPLLPDDVADATEGILNADKQIGKVLELLASPVREMTEDEAALALFVTGGKIYQRNVDGGLEEVGQADKGLPEGWACRFSEEVWKEVEGEQVSSTVVRTRPLLYRCTPEALSSDHILRGAILAMLRALNEADFGKGQAVLDTGDKAYARAVQKLTEKRKDPDTGEMKTIVSYPFVPADIGAFTRAGAKPTAATLGWFKDGTVAPLVRDFAVQAVSQTVGTEASFTEAQVARVLGRLAERGGTPVYVSAGKMFRLDGGKLVADDHPAAEAVAWPLAHDVRPAAQSLGIDQACTDCHAWSAPFLTADVPAVGPIKTDSASVKSMHEFADLNVIYHRILGLTFTVRPLFKIFLVGMIGIIGAVLFVYGMLAIRGLVRCAGPKE